MKKIWCILIVISLFIGCKKQNTENEQDDALFYNANILPSDIIGKWRMESVGGEKISGGITEYMFFENGKLFVLSNPIEENGIQISDELRMRIVLVDYKLEGNTLTIDNEHKNTVRLNNTQLILKTAKDDILVFNKEVAMETIVGEWRAYAEPHYYYTFIINKDLTGTITNEYPEDDKGTEALKFSLEKSDMFNMQFDAKYLLTDGSWRYLLIDSDRIIMVEQYEKYLVPFILQRLFS
ncbi:MAG: hypothetical protein Pg6A_18260 [Termitinemataceae bacterium]|nr:MAG: hypothetical protein Pg6A_18260 [Termitinemataceae bacterium]